jgi:hypothetical protein
VLREAFEEDHAMAAIHLDTPSTGRAHTTLSDTTRAGDWDTSTPRKGVDS